MDLWVVRHAIAEERAEGLLDAERRLTERGEERFGACVRALDGLGVRFGCVLTSPWTRAVQTAAMLAPIADGEPEGCDALCRDPGRRCSTPSRRPAPRPSRWSGTSRG